MKPNSPSPLMVTIDPGHPDTDALSIPATLLREGGLVAFVTETVYGLGANALDPQAVARIFEAKGRPSSNPLIVHVADVDTAKQLAFWNERAEKLAIAFWPGPLTIVLPKTALVPNSVTAGGNTVALRIPSHPVALALLRRAKCPVAAPSANLSNSLSPTRANHVLASLGTRVDCIVDGGACLVGIESTVVDISGMKVQILRPGHITATRIGQVLGEPVLFEVNSSKDEVARSPGNLPLHYAPKTPLEVYLAVAPWRARIAQLKSQGMRVGCLPDFVENKAISGFENPSDWEHFLYQRLHDLDSQDLDFLLVWVPGQGESWEGILDRLRRGARNCENLIGN